MLRLEAGHPGFTKPILIVLLGDALQIVLQISIRTVQDSEEIPMGLLEESFVRTEFANSMLRIARFGPPLHRVLGNPIDCVAGRTLHPALCLDALRTVCRAAVVRTEFAGSMLRIAYRIQWGKF